MADVMEFEDLLEKLRRKYNDEDYRLLESAAMFARKAHEGQFRRSGEPYIVHPCAVVEILCDLGMDAQTLAAAYLHDVVEDTSVTAEEIKRLFGDEILLLVEGVTKIDKMQFKNVEEAIVENLRKMLIAMTHDLRVIIIKLADRLHNMRSLGFTPVEQQLRVSKETLEIYAPLAARFGMGQIKCELEDLAMKYLYPEAYASISEVMNSKKAQHAEILANASGLLSEKLTELGLDFEINGRTKHIYSIYRKMMKQNSSMDEVYDLLAVRVIVDSVKDCYAVLGVVHTLWRPVPGRFKDYIATPKPNNYRSLHTTVFGKDDEPVFEIQIRTREMHQFAEYGIASHWAYKDGKADKSEKETIDAYVEIRRTLELLNSEAGQDLHDYANALKDEVFNDVVYVFTPKGKVINLPAKSIIIDFAYAIHSDVGNKCVGAKIGGKMVPLTTELQTGDIVEVITSNSSKGPSRDWLNLVKTSSARQKINQFFKRAERGDNIAAGRAMLENEIKRRGMLPKSLLRDEWLCKIGQKFSYVTADDVYAAVGYGGLTTNQVVVRLIELYETEKSPDNAPAEDESNVSIVRSTVQDQHSSGDILIDGQSGFLTVIARCCHPIPGDEIIGYTSRGRGVMIHRANCPNLNDLDTNRFVKAEWGRKVKGIYSVELSIEAEDCRGLVSDLTSYIGKTTVIRKIDATVDHEGVAHIVMVLTVESIEDVEDLIKRLRSRHGIYSVRR